MLSNDDRGQLNTLLLHAPDGRLRLRVAIGTEMRTHILEDDQHNVRAGILCKDSRA